MSDTADDSQYRCYLHEIVPGLHGTKHKGQAGRIGIIGGSEEYTGAPYFAGMSALRSGADLCHVFCSTEASTAIKSYSPELIVHPGFGQIESIFPRLHSLVVGPGLGRKSSLTGFLKVIFGEARKLDIPIVVDADGLDFVMKDVSLVQNYTQAILTPNAIEFQRLCKLFGEEGNAESPETVKAVAKLMRVTILRKGQSDIISDGDVVLSTSEPGSGRRCGGQGDILSGTAGLFSFWAHERHKSEKLPVSPTIIACVFASILTRRANRMAFEAYGRSFLTSDMLNFIGKAFDSIVSNTKTSLKSV